MSKTVVNKREQFKWDNGFNPNGETLPTKSTEDTGKVLGVQDNGEWGLLEPSEGTTYTAGTNISISDQNAINCTISYATSSAFGLVKIPDRSPISNLLGTLDIKACDWSPAYSTGTDTGCNSSNASSYQYAGKIYKMCSSGTIANATSSVVDKTLFTIPNLVDVLSCSFVFRNAGDGPWLFAADASNANNPIMEISVSTDGEFIAKTKAKSSFRYNATIIYIVPTT